MTSSSLILASQLAKLPVDDMNAVHNVRLLGGAADTKKSSMSSFSLKFDMHKVDVLVLWITIIRVSSKF